MAALLVLITWLPMACREVYDLHPDHLAFNTVAVAVPFALHCCKHQPRRHPTGGTP